MREGKGQSKPCDYGGHMWGVSDNVSTRASLHRRADCVRALVYVFRVVA